MKLSKQTSQFLSGILSDPSSHIVQKSVLDFSVVTYGKHKLQNNEEQSKFETFRKFYSF